MFEQGTHKLQAPEFQSTLDNSLLFLPSCALRVCSVLRGQNKGWEN